MKRGASADHEDDHGADALKVGGRLALTLLIVAGLGWFAATQIRKPATRTPVATSHLITTTVAYLPLSSIGPDEDPPAAPAPIVRSLEIATTAPGPAPAPEPAAAPPPAPDLAASVPSAAPDSAAPTAEEYAALATAADAAGKSDQSALPGASEGALQRTALEWMALKSAAAPSFATLSAFATAHPDWPSMDWIRESEEAALYRERPAAKTVTAFFAAAPPRTPVGRLVLARALVADRPAEAAQVARAVWREDDLTPWAEGAVLKEFAVLLTPADHRYRAERLLYREQVGAALRTAERAGPAALSLANVWASGIRGSLRDAAWDGLPAALKDEPGLVYLRLQALRRANRAMDAAALLRQAPRQTADFVDGDRWWDERRMVARQLLDLNQPREAYLICAAATPSSVASRLDAQFHAGWMALRFLKDANAAATHFAAAARIARTPLEAARAAYWQGRAAEQANDAEQAQRYYERAAAYPVAFYGQLAAEKIHAPGGMGYRVPLRVAEGAGVAEATRVVGLLYAAKLDRFARPLALDAAGAYRDGGQLAALAQVARLWRDGTTSVEIARAAMERGFALDPSGLPMIGLPTFTPLDNSADLALVYAVAKQESGFAPGAVSGMGARGIMQILPETARATARRNNVAFSPARLTADPAYNTQLGAAYLGQLLNDESGSVVLALAAYNAGAGRVQQWIAAYGDPRTPAIEPIDWAMRIPFDETRAYVEQVEQNLQVYRALLPAAARARARMAAE